MNALEWLRRFVLLGLAFGFGFAATWLLDGTINAVIAARFFGSFAAVAMGASTAAYVLATKWDESFWPDDFNDMLQRRFEHQTKSHRRAAAESFWFSFGCATTLIVFSLIFRDEFPRYVKAVPWGASMLVVLFIAVGVSSYLRLSTINREVIKRNKQAESHESAVSEMNSPGH